MIEGTKLKIKIINTKKTNNYFPKALGRQDSCSLRTSVVISF